MYTFILLKTVNALKIYNNKVKLEKNTYIYIYIYVILC